MPVGLPILALIAGCFLQRDPPCATGYERDADGNCVSEDNHGADNVKDKCRKPTFTALDFGCDGAEVVVTAQTECLTRGKTSFYLLQTGVVDGMAEEHDFFQVNVDPLETWEQLEAVLAPTADPGDEVANTTTAFSCDDLGQPAITIVARTWNMGTLDDCAIVGNDSAGANAVFDGTAPGLDDSHDPVELTEASCTVLPLP